MISAGRRNSEPDLHASHQVRVDREIRAMRIYEGASEVQKVVIARQLLAQAKP